MKISLQILLNLSLVNFVFAMDSKESIEYPNLAKINVLDMTNKQVFTLNQICIAQQFNLCLFKSGIDLILAKCLSNKFDASQMNLVFGELEKFIKKNQEKLTQDMIASVKSKIEKIKNYKNIKELRPNLLREIRDFKKIEPNRREFEQSSTFNQI